MIVRYPLLALPIHRRSREKYYKDHDRWEEKQKPGLEKEWRSRFEEMPPHIRIHWKDRWYWPPWYFNDVIGHLLLGGDDENSMAGDIFLKRRHFQLSAPERLYRHRERAKDREEFLYFMSAIGRSVDPAVNETYVRATREIVTEATSLVREMGRGTRSARIWLPEYDLACINLAAADRQMRQHGPLEEP